MRSCRWLVLVAAWCAAGAACAPRAPARTLGQGQSELAGSLGGPVFANLGVPIPLPMVAVGGRHGVTDGVRRGVR